MAAPRLKAFASALKGTETRKSKCLIATEDPSHVLPDARVKVTGTDSGGIDYEWTYDLAANDIKPKGLKVTLKCVAGNPSFFVAEKRFFGAGDVIDVNVTVTNPVSGGGESGSVDGIVEIE
jgi:hypothetical protein